MHTRFLLLRRSANLIPSAAGWELKLIGGPVTIIGMFEAIDTIVLGIDPDDMVVSPSVDAYRLLLPYTEFAGGGGIKQTADE